jgi:hypothetical protein
MAKPQHALGSWLAARRFPRMMTVSSVVPACFHLLTTCMSTALPVQHKSHEYCVAWSYVPAGVRQLLPQAEQEGSGGTG